MVCVCAVINKKYRKIKCIQERGLGMLPFQLVPQFRNAHVGSKKGSVWRCFSGTALCQKDGIHGVNADKSLIYPKGVFLGDVLKLKPAIEAGNSLLKT